MASAQQEGRRNAVRFELLGDLQMDRLQFSRNVLQKELGFRPIELDYLFAMPGKKIFEVVFGTTDLFSRCLDRFRRKKAEDPSFANIRMQPLSERDTVMVNIVAYTELVNTGDILTWLSYHCEVRKIEAIKDADNILTGARKAFVKLRRDQATGEVLHLPCAIQLGRERCNVFYHGQPKTCRKCGSLDHLAAACRATYCNKCKASTHTTRDCRVPMKCNLCGSESHAFASCPKSWAKRVSPRRDPDLWGDNLETNPGADMEPPPPEGGASIWEPTRRACPGRPGSLS